MQTENEETKYNKSHRVREAKQEEEKDEIFYDKLIFIASSWFDTTRAEAQQQRNLLNGGRKQDRK